ncbi:MAG: WG repeat-containing protein [Microscillaceae bacterium]|nr:WG repeat-containing protein [Microscillaceae bacterium]
MSKSEKIYWITYTLFLWLLSTSASFAQDDPIPVRKGDKWTYTKIGGVYDAAEPFHPVLEKVIVKVPKRDLAGKVVLNAQTKKPEMQDSIYYNEIATLAAVRSGEKWGFINNKGTVVVNPKYDFVEDFTKDGFASVGISGDPFELWGFVNHLGKEIIAPKYNGVSDFKEGFASVALIDTSNFEAPTLGFVDKTGNLSIPIKFHQAHDFNDGMAAVSNEQGKWGFINTKGQMLIPFQFDKVYDFNEGVAKVYNQNNQKWGFIDKRGSLIINYQYQDPGITYGVFQNGLAKVRLNNLEGWIDQKGVIRIPFRYTEARDFSEKMAAIQVTGKWGFIDYSGSVVIPPRFGEVEDFQDGMAPYKEAGMWGFIDTSGKIVIPAKYTSVDKGFARGIALVKKGEQSVYIDKTGKEYIQ